MRHCERFIACLLAIASAVVPAGCGGGGGGGEGSTSWSVSQEGSVIEIAYGKGTDFPQYAALHLESGYLRMNYGPDSGWGASAIVLPSFWTGGRYYQGAPVAATWKTEGDTLVIAFTGEPGGLHARGTIRITPPVSSTISAAVAVSVEGTLVLDDRPGEAFKPVMLSSMHISTEAWDAQSAYVAAQIYQLPESGWIIQPPATGTVFGLKGGTSTWKRNAPTIEIELDGRREITGWVTLSNNPNDDNVGFWASSNDVLSSWEYRITARQ